MFYAGLDLGQKRDHPAIAIVEVEDERRGFQPVAAPTLLLRYVERIPLRVPYPKLVEGLRRILGHESLSGQCALAADATGVGAPVVDMLRAARLGCDISAVNISGGDREHCRHGGAWPVWSVPKQDLMAGVQVLLEQRQLKIAPGLRDVGWLVRELVDVRMKRGYGGRVKLGADGHAEHDDLVIALALACWRAKRKQNGFGTQRLPGI